MTKLQEQFEDETGMVAFGRGIDCKIYSDAYVEWLEAKAARQETIVTEPEHEFEALVEDEDSPFAVGSWIPVTRDRIKDINKIDEYIEKGLLRRVQ